MLVQDKNDLDRARNRDGRVGVRSASASAMFEKVLRAFEIGDLSFSDLQSSMTRLLNDGASADELLRVLRRRESIEPLPEDARDQIIAALHEAMPASAVEKGGVASEAPAAAAGSGHAIRPPPTDEEADTSAMSRLIEEFAAAWDAEPKARPASPAAPPQSNEQNVNYKAMQFALGQREDDLAALQVEHSRVLTLLETRARSVAQLQEELREMSAQLEASRGAMQLQENKTREIEEVLAERIAAEEAAHTRGEQARSDEAAQQARAYQRELRTMRESLAAREASLDEARQLLAERGAAIESIRISLAEREAANESMRRSLGEREAAVDQLSRALTGRDGVIEQARRLLAERDAQIAALQGENARLAPAPQSSAAARDALAARDAWADKVISLQSSLDERDTAIEAQKQHHAKIVAAAMARAKATETELQAARERIEALAAELQSRDWAAAAREHPEEQEQQPGLEPEPGLGQALQPDLEHTLPLQRVFESPQPRLGLRRDLEIEDFRPPPVRARTWRPPNAIVGIVGICAVIAVLAVVGWVAMHREAAAAKKVPAVADAPPPTPGTVIRDCPTCPSFTVLPAGRFKQGSADGSASSSVKPLHWVSIRQPFAMSTSAVTVDQFRAFITATGRDMQGCDAYDGRWKHQDKNSWQSPGFEQNGTHPVTCASWSDATAYAQWLSAQTGHHYRLPSASEWEYAARGGSEAVQPWSANGSDACANANVADLSATRRFPGWTAFNCNDGYVFTAPVGSFKANAFGLNDMLGNVFQWTEDCWNATYKGAPIDGSARTDGNCNEHELRGGSWFSSPGYVRADYRNHFAANYRASSAGIRLARDITP